MKRKHTLIKIVSVFTAFAVIGAGLSIHYSVKPTEVEAAQHTDNFASYTYSGNYYSGINLNSGYGLNGSLRQAITNKIFPQDWYTYGNSGEDHLSTQCQYADEDPTNSANMIYLYTRDSVKKNAASSWNREHVWPQSLSNGCWGKTKAGTDLLHIRPTYSSTNSSRSNDKFCDVNKSTPRTYNGMTFGYGSGEKFEPLDSVKGDVARIIMYVWTAYKNYYSNLPEITNVFESYDTLLKWHTQDRPDVLEGNRNNYVETSIQQNRNPFVDRPDLAWKIFGDQASTSIKQQCQQAYPGDGTSPQPTTLTGISLNKTTTSLVVGNTETLTVSPVPSNASLGTVSWTSNNTAVASINSSGKITANAAGTAKITASCSGFTAYCNVTVTASSSGGQGEYALYTDNISEGDYIIHYNGKNMKAVISSNRAGYSDGTPTNNTFDSNSSPDIVWHITPSGNYYTLYNASVNKYLAGNGTKNQVALVSEVNDYALWTITRSSSTFEMINKGNSADDINCNLRNNGTYGFACYSTQTGGALSLYKKAVASATTYTVTFDSMGGSSIVSQTVAEGSKAQQPANPTKASDEENNYSFYRWCVDEDCSIPYDFDTPVTGDITLYADYIAQVISAEDYLNKGASLALLDGTETTTSSVVTKDIVFGDLDLENGVQYSSPFDGDSFTVTFGGGENDGKYYTTGSGIRTYGNGTITIASKSGDNISKITMTWDGSNKPTSNSAVNKGTYNTSTGVWTGSANSVVFTRPSGSGHWRLQKVEVTCGGESVEVSAVKLRFGFSISVKDWQTIASKWEITDYGVMLFKTTATEFNSETPVKDAFEAGYAPAILHHGSGEAPEAENGYYSYISTVNITKLANYGVTFCAAPFIVADEEYHFFEERQESVYSLAEYYKTHSGCELSYNALLTLLANQGE